MIVRNSRAALAAGTCLAALCWQGTAVAQVTGPETAASAEKEIVVTGIRAALTSAEGRKRDADVVIDGITADDIGLLPDVSISESLTRISGVTANDTARGSDQVAIRGLGPDLASTEYNGRILPTADGVNRRVGLGGLPSEGLRAAFVQKTPDASTIEGGVSGILSLESIRPLESRRKGLTVVARGLYEELSDSFSKASEQRPFGLRGEVTYVSDFSDDFGIALTYAGIKDYSSQAGVQFDSWRLVGGTPAQSDFDGNGIADAFPLNAGMAGQFFNTTRHSVLGMAQWRASSALTISLDGIFSEETDHNHTRRFFALDLWNRPALGAPKSTTVENDTVTQFEGTASLYRGVINDNVIKDHTYGAGLNFDVDDGGPLTAAFDVSYFVAGRDRFTPAVNFDIDATTAVGQRRNFSYDLTHRGNVRFGFDPVNAEDFAIQMVNTTKQDASDKIAAARGDLVYKVDDGFWRSVEFGGRYDHRRHTQRVVNAQYGFANLGARPDLDSSFLETKAFPFAGKANLFGGPSATAFPYYDFDALFRLGTGLSKVAPDPAVPLRDTPDTDIGEDTFALYYQANFDNDVLSGNVGLRWVQTDSKSRGFATTPGGSFVRSFSNSYNFLLPSLNLKYQVAPELYLRAAAARTISKPLFEDLSVGGNIDFDPNTNLYIVNSGNPKLSPFTSDGIDVGIEWYPDRSTSIAVTGYYKWVSNFITSSTRFGTIPLADGTLAPAQITETRNDPASRYFRGVEVQFRKDFNFLPGLLSNLGVQANYNYNETDARETFPSLAGPPAIATTVEVMPINLSKHVVNAILYYDSGPLNFRLAYRYYSSYSRRFARGYQYQPGGQLDFNFGLKLTENIRLIGTVTNVLGTSQYRLTEDSRNAANDKILQFYGTRGRDFALGARFQF